MSQARALPRPRSLREWARHHAPLLVLLALALLNLAGWAVLIGTFIGFCAVTGAILQTYLTALAMHPSGALAFPVYGVVLGAVTAVMAWRGER